MPNDTFDVNRLMMMINILNAATQHLKDELDELKIQEVEQQWKQLLSTLHDCFAYAQSNGIDLREYKSELQQIVYNLYSVEKVVHRRKDNKVSVVDDFAKSVIYIAGKIDDVLDGIGWKRVVRPITEAIFMIPKKIISMFSNKSDTSKMLPEVVEQYLPPPMKSLPSWTAVPPSGTGRDTVVDVEWREVEDNRESYASRLLRQMNDRISRAESEDLD